MVIANYVLFHIRVHWVLCVVDLSSSTVYYMDSINKEVHSPLKLLIKTAFKIYDSSKGVRSSRIINWKPVECPKQPTNVECGFYVMKYMNDLIRDEKILSRGNFNGKKTYTKAEIDEVRAKWIKSVINEV
ncbi:hypothetical protein RHMOL_Rhmol11G0070000 [Rhododendron molle]|uniref:Uncharacterized protein n=2 Tax=Rhododendron molle TaxID=49168 RepID=A0ACC0LPK0_RHOML|nr:hypothetical protein RHMOL_Rhmol11G0070000 [Rhododendron molle]KAI8530570.1 hypothetical protein RHMOL_Rhmol11G0070000 [Rhododendron molle]